MEKGKPGIRPRILVVDDDKLILKAVCDILKEAGLEVAGAGGGTQALSLFRQGDWDVVVTDIVMEDMSGIDLLKEIKGKDGLKPVICMSSRKSFDDVVEMLRNGAYDFIDKPVEPDRLLRSVTSSYEQYLQTLEKEKIVARSNSWGRELLALRHLGESSSRDMLQVLFRKTVEAVADTMQAETVSLMVLEGDHLTVMAAIGLPEDVIGRAQVPLGKGISGYVAETGEPVLINDISNHDRFQPSRYRKQYRTESALCVPLVRGDKVLGVINANNKTSGAVFEESDLDLLGTVASQVAMAIDNARLYQGLEEKAGALERAHQELIRLDKDKTELILNISHELKTPLTSIIGFASLIHGLDLEGDRASLENFVERLERSARQLNHLVERMLELFRLEAGRVRWKRSLYTADDLVGACLADMEGVLGGRKVDRDTSAASGVKAYCDRSLFVKVLGLLLDNAVKFSPEGSSIAIRGYGHDRMPSVPDYARHEGLGRIVEFSPDGWMEFVVSDRGVGMRDTEIPHIFEKFRQLGDILTTKPTGIGLGLSIARVILERHGGTIWAESVLGEGSHFHLLLPGKEA
ncbi:MAG: response regulator [bacterium]|nr:MAG: response regulator [bacterium]